MPGHTHTHTHTQTQTQTQTQTHTHTHTNIHFYRNIYIKHFLFNYCIFTIYSRYLKRVISKRDGCEYLKQVPSIDGSLELIYKVLFYYFYLLLLFIYYYNKVMLHLIHVVYRRYIYIQNCEYARKMYYHNIKMIK
jgi:hypothetical protein